jgi:hypothetical protein
MFVRLAQLASAAYHICCARVLCALLCTLLIYALADLLHIALLLNRLLRTGLYAHQSKQDEVLESRNRGRAQ